MFSSDVGGVAAGVCCASELWVVLVSGSVPSLLGMSVLATCSAAVVVTVLFFFVLRKEGFTHAMEAVIILMMMIVATMRL